VWGEGMMWIALIYALNGEPLYPDRYYFNKEACLDHAEKVLKYETTPISKITCIDPYTWPKDGFSIYIKWD
jgi:hypothetical protein